MKKEREFALEFVLKFFWILYVVMVAVVVVIVDVDDEEGEGGGEDAQRRMLCTMQSFFDIHMALSLHSHCCYESSCCASTTEVVSTQMHFREDSDLS